MPQVKGMYETCMNETKYYSRYIFYKENIITWLKAVHFCTGMFMIRQLFAFVQKMKEND